MFSQVCVKNTVYRGVSITACTGAVYRGACITACTGAVRHHPAQLCWDTPPAQCMLGYTPGRHPLGQTAPPQQTPPPPVRTPPSRHLPGQTPPPMATAADGIHPTGMHSCLNCRCMHIEKKWP